MANDQTPTNNTVTNNTTTENTLGNNVIEELPQTGTSIWEYIMYILGVSIVLIGIAAYFNRRKNDI